MNDKTKVISFLLCFIIIFYFIFCLFRVYINLDVNIQTRNDCTIIDKYLDVDKTRKHDTNEYAVVSTCGVYNIRDNRLTNLEDTKYLYDSLSIGHTYNIVSFSYEIPIMSFHPKIVKAVLIK